MKLQGVYILECANGAFYVGSSKDILRRLDEHNAGIGAAFTRKNGPCKLVYTQEYSRIDDAFRREHQLKKWTRAKKIALINGTIKSDKRKSKVPERNESASASE